MTTAIKTNRLDGDLAVGRNIAAGGNVQVQGNTHLKGALKVDGWLEADNITGANKGVFSTLSDLQAEYPNPVDGWWAIVGTSIPGPLYAAANGSWAATGETGGNITIQLNDYVTISEMEDNFNSIL